MFNISFVSKIMLVCANKLGLYLFHLDGTVMSELAIYRVGKLIALPCCMTCKVLAAEWHDQHGWPYLNTAANAFHIKIFSGRWKLGKMLNISHISKDKIEVWHQIWGNSSSQTQLWYQNRQFIGWKAYSNILLHNL